MIFNLQFKTPTLIDLSRCGRLDDTDKETARYRTRGVCCHCNIALLSTKEKLVK